MRFTRSLLVQQRSPARPRGSSTHHPVPSPASSSPAPAGSTGLDIDQHRTDVGRLGPELLAVGSATGLQRCRAPVLRNATESNQPGRHSGHHRLPALSGAQRHRLDLGSRRLGSVDYGRGGDLHRQAQQHRVDLRPPARPPDSRDRQAGDSPATAVICPRIQAARRDHSATQGRYRRSRSLSRGQCAQCRYREGHSRRRSNALSSFMAY